MINKHDRGAVFVLFSFLLIVLLVAGAGVLSLGYIKYERKAIHEMGQVAVVGSTYIFMASLASAGDISVAKQVAAELMASNKQAMRLGRFFEEGLTFSNFDVIPGAWDFANAPNCNSGGTAPGGCYTAGVPVASANALELSFRGKSGADKIFGGLLNSGRIERDYKVYAAYDQNLGPVVVQP